MHDFVVSFPFLVTIFFKPLIISNATMTKPRRGKSASNPGGASPVGPTMDSLHHMMIEQFENLRIK